ncbi:peptide-methionine (R)-S-oxide reductase MsrB [Granulosicoccaceae sp. 1_MG-2023]|nr:peptide-methionine (R)-S-oxide reductase MsrB [Granulosicoccaceae sp. 1_MG-2023]
MSVPQDQDLKNKLDEEQFRVTQHKGTEAPFSGRFYQHKEAGTYTCVCCAEPLFPSQAKYDSGSGWPSFWQPVSESAVAVETDHSHGMVRTEVLCGRCGAHLGHVFEDGPQPTGLRYCINSASLDFVAAEGEGE